jgi:hypothetical protein
MDGLLSTLKEIEPFVTILGFGVTIYLLIWRVPSKAHMKRLFDNIQTQLERNTSSLQEHIGKAHTTPPGITNEIREDMRLMQSQMVRLGEKIDANTEAIHANAQAIHADISKLTVKIEIVSHAMQVEVGNRDDQESPSQS